MTTSPLKESFEQLRQHARHLDDLQAWFKENPSVFAGPLRSFHAQAEDVELEIDPDTIAAHLVDTESMLVTVRIWMLAQWDLDPVLDGLVTLSEDDKETAEQHEYQMHLKFADWPLATAVLVATYFVQEWHATNLSHLPGFQEQLNTWIDLHFPGMNLTKLTQLHNADLLVPDDDTLLGVQNIIDLLFTAREDIAPRALPHDIVPDNDQ